MRAPRLKGAVGRPTNLSTGKMPPRSSALGKAMGGSISKGNGRPRQPAGLPSVSAPDYGISFGDTGGALTNPIQGGLDGPRARKW